MKDGKNDVEFAHADCGQALFLFLKAHQPLLRWFCQQGRVVALGGISGSQCLHRIARGQPAPIFGDADGHDGVSLRVDGAHHALSRHERYFVLARSPAK
jgi:hypothetical protein